MVMAETTVDLLSIVGLDSQQGVTNYQPKGRIAHEALSQMQKYFLK